MRGIQQALVDHDVRVRFPWEHAESTHPRIVDLTVDQGFFKDVSFSFNESLNCLVGGTGTGKSTVIELLRFCFGDVSIFEAIREDHEGKIRDLVGLGGTVSVKYLDSDGEVKIIRREVRDGPTEREVRDNAGNATKIESAPTFFSQGELVRIASALPAQMDLLDRRLDLGNLAATEAAALTKLKKNALDLIANRDRVATLEAELEHPETGRASTEGQLKALEKQLGSDVLKSFPEWVSERELVAAVGEELGRVDLAVDEAFEMIELDGLAVLAPDKTPHPDILKPLARIPGDLKKTLDKAKKDVRSAVKKANKVTKKVSEALEPLFRVQKDKHDAVLKSLGAADVRKANAKFQSLKKRLDHLNKNASDLKKVRQARKDLTNVRTRLRKDLVDARQERWEKRQAKAKEFEGELSGMMSLDVLPEAGRDALGAAIRDLSKGAMLHQPHIDALTELPPRDLVEYLLNDDVKGIAGATGIGEEHAKKLFAQVARKPTRAVFALEEVLVHDVPKILYVVDEHGAEKPLSGLSTGQKGTVIISLAMVDGQAPLVIDQPEEPLDTRTIWAQVVQKLREKKEKRQFLFTTHNPNVAVGADAELSHVLDASASSGRIRSSGGVDDPKTNKLLLLHLEGGREALEVRIKKYAS